MVRLKSTIRGLPNYNPARKRIDEVKQEYGLKNIIKLDSNENPFGCSPILMEKLLPSTKRIARYPDWGILELREETACHLKVKPEQLIFGNGSSELLQLISRCFLEQGDNVVTADVTYPHYKTNAYIEGAEVTKVPLKDGRHDLSAMAQAVNASTKIIWICNPNNPTGTIVSSKEMHEFMRKIPNSVLVVIDEAYYDYVTDSSYPDMLSQVGNYPNLIILRTFSKIYGLASLRIGYGITTTSIVKKLNRIRDLFNVNFLAQRAAYLALQDQSFIQECHHKNSEGLYQLTAALDRLGLHYFPSQGNFLFVETGFSSGNIYEYLLKKGVVVRVEGSWRNPTAVRVTVGSKEENQVFLNELEHFLKQKDGAL